MFSSGRLGHLWPFVNGVARANPDKAVDGMAILGFLGRSGNLNLVTAFPLPTCRLATLLPIVKTNATRRSARSSARKVDYAFGLARR